MGNRYECERTGHDTGIVEAIVLCKDTCSPLNELLSGVGRQQRNDCLGTNDKKR